MKGKLVELSSGKESFNEMGSGLVFCYKMEKWEQVLTFDIFKLTLPFSAFLFLAIKCQKKKPNPMELNERETGGTFFRKREF